MGTSSAGGRALSAPRHHLSLIFILFTEPELTPLPQAIRPKYAVINRAPVMMAWAFVVAERLGFEREEALSIGAPFSHSVLPGAARTA